MNSAPRDGTPILVGYWEKDQESKLNWAQFVVSLRTLDEHPEPYEYDAWTVIPKPPSWGRPLPAEQSPDTQTWGCKEDEA